MLFYFAPSGLDVEGTYIGGLHPLFKYDALSGLDSEIIDKFTYFL
jgi:hypothetical protein